MVDAMVVRGKSSRNLDRVIEYCREWAIVETKVCKCEVFKIEQIDFCQGHPLNKFQEINVCMNSRYVEFVLNIFVMLKLINYGEC